MIILVVSIVLFVLMYQKKVLAQKNEIQLAENRHQRELLDATLEVAEQEREKIAKNLHDDVGSMLNVIKLHLTKLARNPNEKELSGEIVKESMGMVDETIQTVRGISQDLMPPTLVKLGLEKGVLELCKQINATGKVKIDFANATTSQRLASKVELQLYRVIREVINNILKHSSASEITLTLCSSVDFITVKVTHNGIGISDEMVKELTQSKGGIGLKSIQSRIQLIKGSIHYYYREKNSAEIVIQAPFS